MKFGTLPYVCFCMKFCQTIETRRKFEVYMAAHSELWYSFIRFIIHELKLTLRLEYDREQLALVENKGRGLGTMGQWEGKDNWYGILIVQLRLGPN
jgi:hypothetical protein